MNEEIKAIVSRMNENFRNDKDAQKKIEEAASKAEAEPFYWSYDADTHNLHA